jgi:hypothetical protein
MHTETTLRGFLWSAKGLSLVADQARPNILLGIADTSAETLTGDLWIGAFVALGSLLRKHMPKSAGRQLVVALSVPRRDYVAALVGAGWMLSAPTPKLREPIEVFRAAKLGTPLRAVTEQFVAAGAFTNLDENRPDPRVTTGGRTRLVSFYRAVAELDAPCDPVQGSVPEAGFLGEWTGVSKSWLERVAAPSTDLVLVGTKKWLEEDMTACIGNAGVNGAAGTPFANYVLPVQGKVATWATEIIPSTRLSDGESIPSACKIVVLDRYGAVKYLNEISAPIVVCVVDRSVADDLSAELILQTRLSNSRPISSARDLGWSPPVGVEIIAFTVSM